ncbi:MAG: response regulator transcription factor [Deltaproteobacteria bacterium]|nr:response regulator transcription factor [Deltaproteobacteria bacterium]
MNTLRVLVADDHALFRQGLKKILEEMADVEVVGESGDGLELIALIDTLKPDMILLDISMPNVRGIEAIAKIKANHPEVKILIVTMHNDKECLCQAMTAGADGYFLKQEVGTELFSAIQMVRDGNVYVSPPLSNKFAEDWERIREGFRKPLLTSREKEVLSLIGQGKTNKAIGDLLFISVHTVERHRANILRKLNLHGTADLIKYVIEKRYA